MPKINFTYLTNRNLESHRQEEYFDTVTPGLGLRVSPGGAKTFFYRYRYRGKTKRYTIERFTKEFGVTEARAVTDRLRSKVKDGADPAGERQARKQTPELMTLKELSDIYNGIHLPTLRQSTQDYHTWAMDVKVLPTLAQRNLKEITRQDIIRLLDKIAIDGGAAATANKVRSRLHHVFEFAKSRGFVDKNPVSETGQYKSGNNQSERFYSADEIQSIWQQVEQLSEPVRSYMKIIMLCGQRRTETHYMKWENIEKVDDTDFKGWSWTIPKELAKSGRDHLVPLSPLAVEVVEALRVEAGNNAHVFASRAKDDIPIGLKTIKRATKTIRDNSEVPDFRLHDMRRTVATWLAKLGTPAEVVSKVLNHKTGGGGSLVTRIYNRYEYQSERQQALNLWAAKLHQIVTGEKTKIHKIRIS